MKLTSRHVVIGEQQSAGAHERARSAIVQAHAGKAKMVKVTTGIADDTSMEIKSGIKEGDEVISGSYSAISRKLKDGAKVTIDKEPTK